MISSNITRNVVTIETFLTDDVYVICENCVLLAKGLKTRLLFPLPTNPDELIERFSCNLQEIDCVMDRCPTCCLIEIKLQMQPKCSQVLGQMILVLIKLFQ